MSRHINIDEIDFSDFEGSAQDACAEDIGDLSEDDAPAFAPVEDIEYVPAPGRAEVVEDFEDTRTIHEKFADASEARPGLTMTEFLSWSTTTDTGNAERLELRFGDQIRFISAKQGGSWIAYNGKNWERESLAAADLMKRTAMLIAKEAGFVPPALPGEDDEAYAKRSAKWRDGRAKFYTRSLNAKPMEDALKVARINLRARETDFDTKPNLLNTPGGTIDLTDGSWSPNSADDMLTGITNSRTAIRAARVEWEGFIRDICKDADGNPDPGMEHYLKVALGYCLFGDNREALLFIFTGDERNAKRNGRNGKSLLLQIIQHVLGDDYCFPFECQMLARVNGKDPESKWAHRLLGRRIAYSAEYKATDVICTATLKRFVGEDRFDGRYLNNDSFVANMTATLILLSNEIPQMSSNEKAAVWDKIRRIRFRNYFWNGQGEEPEGHYQRVDHGLKDRLKAERNGILNWLIEGAVEYAEKGLPDYADAIASLDEIKADADPVEEFLADCVVREEGARITAKDLYDAYVNHARSNGAEPLNTTAFGRLVNSKQLEAAKIGGTKYRIGARFNVIGLARLQSCDPAEAVRFVAKEVMPAAPKAVDAEAAVFDAQSAADAHAQVNRPARVLHGDKMSPAELNKVKTGNEGERFTVGGVLYEIVKAGSAVKIENVIPFTAKRR